MGEQGGYRNYITPILNQWGNNQTLKPTLKSPPSKLTVGTTSRSQFTLERKQPNTLNERLKNSLAIVPSEFWKYLQGYYQKSYTIPDGPAYRRMVSLIPWAQTVEGRNPGTPSPMSSFGLHLSTVPCTQTQNKYT